MGSASREALTAARATLGPLLGAKVGSELLSASSQIEGSPALLSALANTSVEGATKSQLAERLFGGVSTAARQVLAAAVAQTWSSPDELVAGIEELGLRADAIAHADLADELLAAAAVIDSSHDLELSLGNKLGDAADKLVLIERIFSGKLSPSAIGVVNHLVAHPRGRGLSTALQQSARVVADQGGSELATITVSAPLSAEQQTRLATLLERSAGRPVRVTTVVDPSLVGGVRIQIGDDVIDGSIRSRLEDLRLRLAG